MLRCAPSRIHLTSSDLDDFEHRFVARHDARNAQIYKSAIRLSPGPSRQTSLSLVSEIDNHGRKRTVSSGSCATVYSIDDVTHAAVPTNNRPHDASDQCTATTVKLGFGADEIIVSNATDEVSQAEKARQRSLQFGNITLDGFVQIRPAASPARSRDTSDDVPVSRRDVPILGEIHSDASPTETPQQRVPGLLSSARARRRHARSHETSISEDPAELQQFIQHRHVSRLPSHTSLVPDLPPPVPELVLPDGNEDSRSITNPYLDPGAPGFVPRARFGTVNGSSNGNSLAVGLEPQWSSLDSIHISSNLRLRSSSEQNVDPVSRHRAQIQRPETAQPRHRRRSRVSDQNEPLPVLDRYPLLRPNPRPSVARRSSVIHRPTRFPGRRPSRISFVSSHALPSMARAFSTRDHDDAAVEQADTREPHTNEGPSNLHDVHFRDPRLRPHLSPEPQITRRSSSLSWREHITPSHCAPSITSAASGISRVLSSSGYSGHGISAADEFLQMRNSPLDDLTERLSRLSGNRPRSVGRSWERPPGQRPRPSLLNGNPFRQDSSPTPRGGFQTVSSPIPDFSTTQDNDDITHGTQTSPAAPLASPGTGSNSIAAVLSGVDSPAHAVFCSPRRVLAETSPGKVQSSPSRSGGVALAPSSPVMATPRVKIYDDAQPAVNQPQTPADMARSSHRFRGRSGMATQASVATTGALPPSSPPVPRQQNRHTYPSTTTPASHASPPAQALHALRNAATSAAHQILQHTRLHRHRPSSDENDDHDMHAFEEEHRVWMERQDAGTLYSTPPAEGRLEQYMS